MKVKIDNKVIERIKLPDTGRIEISDTLRRGLYLRAYASGRMTWMYEKRIKNGPKRKHTLGVHSKDFGLKEARAVALVLETEAARGFDRVAIAIAAKIDAETAQAKALSVRQALDLYTDLHLKGLKRGGERRTQIEQSLFTHLDAPLASLVKSDLQRAIDEKASAGRLVAANRIRAALMAFTGWAYARDHIEDHVGEKLAKPAREQARTRTPSITEVQAIWDATYQVGPLWGPAFRLLILTAQRRQEILGLKWSEVDLIEATITKPGTQTKNGKEHVTHLSAPALQELRGLHEVAGRNKELIFTTTGTTPISGVSSAKRRLDKLVGDGAMHWRIHDLRTAFATAMANSGVSEAVADRILNHSAVGSAPSAVSRVYNQSALLPQRANALNKWAALVTSEQYKVVQIHG